MSDDITFLLSYDATCVDGAGSDGDDVNEDEEVDVGVGANAVGAAGMGGGRHNGSSPVGISISMVAAFVVLAAAMNNRCNCRAIMVMVGRRSGLRSKHDDSKDNSGPLQ